MDERSGNGTKNSELTSLRMIRVLLHKLLNFNVEDKSTMKTALNDLNYYILKYPKYKKLNTILAGGWNYRRMSPNEAVAQITRLQKFVEDQDGNMSSIEGSVLNIILKKILSIYLKEVGQENNSSKEYGSENSNHITSGAFAITELEGHSREKIEHETESGSGEEIDPNELGEYTTSEPDSYSSEEVEYESEYESEYSYEVNFDTTTFADNSKSEPKGHSSKETDYELDV